MWTENPAALPNTDSSAARRPRATPRLTTNSTLGPGTMIRAKAATANANTESIGGTPREARSGDNPECKGGFCVTAYVVDDVCRESVRQLGPASSTTAEHEPGRGSDRAILWSRSPQGIDGRPRPKRVVTAR